MQSEVPGPNKVLVCPDPLHTAGMTKARLRLLGSSCAAACRMPHMHDCSPVNHGVAASTEEQHAQSEHRARRWWTWCGGERGPWWQGLLG